MQDTIENEGERAVAPRGTPSGSPMRGEAKQGLTSRLSLFLFIAMVILAPVPDGSAGQIWVQVWTAAGIICVVLASYSAMRRADVLLFLGLAIMLAAYGAVAVLQSISPGPAPLATWSQAAELLQIEIPARSGSVDGSPLRFLGRPLLASLLVVAGMAVGKNARASERLVRSFIYSATLLVIIAFIAYLLGIEDFRSNPQGGALTVFFISKNTSATYLGSAFLAAFALLVTSVKLDRRTAGFRSIGEQLGESKGRYAIAVAALLLLMLLPLTLSRAGVALTFALAAGTILLRMPRRRNQMIGSGIAILVFVSIIFSLSGDAWLERQTVTGFKSGRTEAYAIMAAATLERPWLGYGLGSFSLSFSPLRDESIPGAGHFNIGHSTPLELAFEGGIPLALTVIAFSVVVATILLRGAIRRPSDPFILAGLLVGLLGVLHSSIDFSLQIPGYLIVCLAIVGVGLGRALSPEHRVQRRRRSIQGGHESAAEDGQRDGRSGDRKVGIDGAVVGAKGGSQMEG
ncbi:O-antigen ligase family protein [Xanthobacter sp. AM11]|uniref:O-antigen ligase family protein n=1 Tax=Xanthobacter sp. AM11 TaxID=3380643 RepID=UPI0039BED72C